ncbi:MAG TPA: outer membrane protein assembly factor BamA [Terriglobales bacterium]
MPLQDAAKAAFFSGLYKCYRFDRGGKLVGPARVTSLRKPTTPFIIAIGLLGAALALVTPLAWTQNPPPVPIPENQTVDTQTHPAPELNGAAKYQGEMVRDIQFRGIAGTNATMLRSLMLVKPGEPLDRDSLRESIKVLYSTGRFSSLHVEASPAQPNGITLTFVATENYFNGDVNVDGLNKKTLPKPHQLVNASKLDLGELFSEENVKQAMQRMTKVLGDNGYYQPAISYELKPRDTTRQMDMDFRVAPGELARVGMVKIEGDTGIPQEQILQITKLKPGAKVKNENLTRALERLRKYYQKNQHLEAQVSLTDRDYRPETNTLNYTFEVEQGSKVVITTEGAKIRTGEMKKLVPVYQENAVDDDLLNEGRRNLRNYLQTKGYSDATVEVERRPVSDEDQVNIVYKIDEGSRHELAAIKIVGNKYFDEATIRERMSIQPKSWILTNGRFSQRMMSDDAANIRALYQANGFHDVKVDASLDEGYESHPGELAVVFQITEGTQTLVKNLVIDGNNSFTTEQLAPLLSSVPGQPFSEVDIMNDRDALTYYYYNRGFPDVQFESAAKPVEGEPYRMDLTYTIAEGQRVNVDRLIVTGLEHTRQYILNRQIRIGPGDPMSQAAMVESQRRLYNLGIFNQVDMAIQNPEGIEPQKNVLFNLAEAPRWTFRYGGGIEFATGNTPAINNPQGTSSVSPNGVLEITRLNMFGRDQTLSLRARVGLLTRRAVISYDAPRLFNSEKWRLTLSAFYDNTVNVNTFTSERLEGSFGAEERYSRATTFLYRMSYQRVRVDPASLVIDPNLIPLYSRPVRIAMPSFTWVRDRRDNPVDTHKGSYNLLDTGLATSALGSESNFGKFLYQNSTYYTLHKKWVLARNTQIGLEYPYGTNYYPGGSATAIPLPELFFAGGGNSLRGFAINQAGPRDLQTGYPIGGQALFVNNFEIRTPPVLLPYAADNLSFVFFHDMGNVFATPNKMLSGLVRFNQPSISACTPPDSTVACNFSYNPQAIGIGIRYKTPVGPVRGDISYNFSPTRYPVRDQDTVQTLKHFNYFFSIGQTF